MKTRKTIGLALGSGAYRGFAHIGVIKSLEKNNISIDYLSGASIGAWVAAYYAFFKDISELENDLIDNQKENLSVLLDFGGSRGLISGQKFLKYLSKKLYNAQFSDLKIPLAISATDLKTGLPHVFSDGDLASAVRASCSVPLVFKAFEYENSLLVDGGMSNPVPVDLITQMGADITIGVNLYNKNEFSSQKHTEANLLVHSTVIMLAGLARFGMKNADVVIEPDLSGFIKKNSLSKYFDRKTADEMIGIGEAATDLAIPAIKSLLS